LSHHAVAIGASAQVCLRAAGVGLILDLTPGRLPVVAHWGADPRTLDGAAVVRAGTVPLATNGVDQPVPVALLPEPWTGWTGTPGLVGHRAGEAWAPRFVPTDVSVDTEGTDQGGRVVVDAHDDAAQLAIRLVVELLPTGVLRAHATVRNDAPGPFWLQGLDLALPVPPTADEILDFAGRWALERVPQRHSFVVGTHLREGRHGRTGADAAFVTVAGPAGFGFRSGEVWGVHVAWSGNHRVVAERAFDGERLLAGGELLLPGEVELGLGESYMSPWLYGSYGDGLDELAGRFHDTLRARPHHPRTPRRVVLNVWEAVYFAHDLDKLRTLADIGAEIGVERFVLDDGWFRGRRDDTGGLGDWYVDPEVWPHGLGPLIRHVHDLGMEFGLWVEPEMVNPDSDLARAHPDWIMQVPGRLPVEARHQQVLDLTHAETWEYVHERLTTLVHELGIDYLKWDHNRDLVDAGSTRNGRAGVHEQTAATYRLMDAVRAACPGLEIESCSSGGARVDLEMIEHTDRVWASDCIDAHDRQQIQRWTAQLLPPELVGSHVGADRAHTTGRVLDLSFRAGTALFGHFGIEWDLTEATANQLDELAAWVALYKERRELLHHGRMVRADLPEIGLWLHGVVAENGNEALYAVVGRDRPATWPPGRLTLPGLDPGRTYRVRSADPRPLTDPKVVPAWWAEGLVLPGSVLGNVGVAVPALEPDQIALLHVTETTP